MVNLRQGKDALLDVQNVTKTFGGTLALSGVSLEVYKGELVGIIGPNGSGKTTLFNVISGVFPCDQGKLYFKGKEINGLQPHQTCKLGLARTFQITQSFGNLSVFETVLVAALNRLSLSEAKKRACRVLETVGLAGKAGIISAELTAPDLKALELAKALATGADTILLDEVMAGLIPTEARKMVTVIKELRNTGMTFVVVEHIMPVMMELAERVIVLDFGQKIAEGKPGEIANSQKVIECYLGSGENLA